MKTGHDCAVGRATEARAASKLEVAPGERVPGTPDRAANVYDAYQALLWLAGKERAVERQENFADEAETLAALLIPKDQPRQPAAP